MALTSAPGPFSTKEHLTSAANPPEAEGLAQPAGSMLAMVRAALGPQLLVVTL